MPGGDVADDFAVTFGDEDAVRVTLGVVVPMWTLSYILFHKVLIVPWPQTLVGDWFPELRSNIWLNLF